MEVSSATAGAISPRASANSDSPARTNAKRAQSITYAAARAELHSLVKQSQKFPRAADVKHALEELEQAFVDAVVAPLETAAANASGLEAWHGQMSAELARDWFASLPLVIAARRVLEGQYPHFAEPIGDDALDRKLKFVSALKKTCFG